jgi:hypothetical protein
MTQPIKGGREIMEQAIKQVIRSNGAVNGALEVDGFEGCTVEQLRDCPWMDGMSQEELQGVVARTGAAIREAANQRLSALRRLAR